jgi:hypothetical protein
VLNQQIMCVVNMACKLLKAIESNNYSFETNLCSLGCLIPNKIGSNAIKLIEGHSTQRAVVCHKQTCYTAYNKGHLSEARAHFILGFHRRLSLYVTDIKQCR